MSVLQFDTAARLLSDLVAIPSVNPMGRPYLADRPVERQVIEYVERLFSPYGVESRRLRCSPIHECLLIVVPGQNSGPWTLFESHADTVPADDWPDRAFSPRLVGHDLYGRGACDDKGCLVAMALALLDLLDRRQKPVHPIAFLVAGDEEYTQTGIKHFVEQDYSVGCGIFGEPTSLVPVVQHKGTVRWDITVHGRSAHTSRPELGSNAILAMIQVIQAIQSYQSDLQGRHTNPLMTGPTLTVTMIHGGRTRNSVPDECTLALDFRILPGMDPARERQQLIDFLQGLELPITHGPVQLMTPPLNTATTGRFSQGVLQACQAAAGRPVRFAGAPYGTDAAWMTGQVPAIVLGPGDIASAHAIDEHVDVREVVACASIYQHIMLNDGW